MNYEMKFYRDGEGDPRCESGAPGVLIGPFLTEDVQDSLNTCREILDKIERIANGEIGSWRRVGNAHVLALSADEAVIESVAAPDERASRLSLEDFRHILESWLHFLEENWRRPRA
jgi:uncharacterized protein YacL (UPF0231 family)